MATNASKKVKERKTIRKVGDWWIENREREKGRQLE